MKNLILQTIDEKDLEKAVDMLRTQGVLSDKAECPLCSENIDNIGGFIPHESKVAPICDKFSCILKASYAVMKFNGNGSPIIE